VNKCATCGLFKRWCDLILHFTPDSECGPEDSWYECKGCLK
jgi:hypothetical protein